MAPLALIGLICFYLYRKESVKQTKTHWKNESDQHLVGDLLRPDVWYPQV